jgi:hypothetical protein
MPPWHVAGQLYFFFTLKRVRCRVKIQKDLSDPFITERGLRQGDTLACLLFNIALEKVIRDSGIERRGAIYHISVQVLAYADDLDIIGRSERAVREAFTKFDKEALLMGLKINETKTKYMEITTNPTRTEFLAAGNYKFEKVTEFKYLGTLITSNSNTSSEIHHRLLMDNRCYYGLKNQLRSLYISTKTKCKLYKTLIKPVLLYGCETWAMGINDKSKISIFERKVLRKIYGPVNDKGKWRIRYNNELYQLLGEPDIIKEVKARRVRCLGHLFSGTESNPCRKLTFTTPEGARRVGQPPKKWLECAEEDLRSIGVSRWKIMVPDKVGWRSIVGAVKARTKL